MIGTQFKIHGEFDLVKSAPAADKGIVIRGRILEEKKDVQGETPIVAEMDWSHFDKRGFIKDEHDPVEFVMEKGQPKVLRTVPSPDNIIGIPLKREVVGKSVFITARLFPNNPRTIKLIDLMRSFDEHNRLHPESPRHVGFSIEGNYTKKLPNGRYAGSVYNVALTHKPQDPETFAEVVTLAKSMMAGYATSPETMAGGGTLRRESLEGSKRNHSSTNPHEVTMFKSKSECYAHHMKAGKSKEDAARLAAEWEEEQGRAKGAKAEAFGKSIQTALDAFKKSLTVVNEFVPAIEKRATEIAGFGEELRKSIEPVKEGKEVDGVKLLETQASATISVGDIQKESSVALAKSMAAIAEGMTEIVNLVKSMQEQQTATQEFVESVNTDLQTFVKGVRINGGRTTENLDRLPVEGVQVAGLNKSVSKRDIGLFLVRRGQEEAGAGRNGNVYFNAHDAFRVSGLMGLNKSIQEEVIKQFPEPAEA